MTAALDAIRALAEAATPGPWHHENKTAGAGYGGYVKAGMRSVADARYRNGAADGEYIAALDPQTVLALLAALDRAEAVVAAARVVSLSLNGDLDYPGAYHEMTDLRDRLRAYEDADKVADG